MAIEENSIISEWEKTQAELDQAELDKRKAEEEAAKAEAEKLKAETEKIREGESPSSTASETEKSESWKEVAEIQAKRIDALAKLMTAESESRKAEWQEAQAVIADMKEALELNSELIAKQDQSTQDLMLATSALVKLAQDLKTKK